MHKKLIVNADDYGVTKGVSAGIRKSHLEGIVTTTTALMNMPAVKDELLLVPDACPTLGCGVHLNITAGFPLRSPATIPSLVTSEGKFHNLKNLVTLFLHVDPVQLRDEWRAQIDAFLRTGLILDHLDSHHHISYLHPKLFAVMLDLAQEYDTAIRYPPSPPGLIDNAAIDENQSTSKKYSPQYPDRLYTSFSGDYATVDTLRQVIRDLPPGSSEIMVHPGFVDDELRSCSSYNEDRGRELAILTDKKIISCVKEHAIELITFKQL